MTANVRRYISVADYEAENCQPSINFNTRTNDARNTKPAIEYTCCYQSLKIMTDRQFVRIIYPRAELDFCPANTVTYGSMGGMKIKSMISIGNDWYNIRTKFMGKKIGRGGSTALRAWKQAKIAIKEQQQQ